MKKAKFKRFKSRKKDQAKFQREFRGMQKIYAFVLDEPRKPSKKKTLVQAIKKAMLQHPFKTKKAA